MRMENDRALDCAGAARLLGEWDQILLLCHASPDGDTLGSATALCRGLRALGKTVNIDCADPIPEKFQYLFEGLPQRRGSRGTSSPWTWRTQSSWAPPGKSGGSGPIWPSTTTAPGRSSPPCAGWSRTAPPPTAR